MKDENDFNRMLSKEFKRFYPNVRAEKLSDKYKTGISDFVLWGRAGSVALEVKFTQETGKSVALPGHTFSPQQVRFLKDIQLTGNQGWGLIVIEETKLMYLVNPLDITDTGNVLLSTLNHSQPFSRLPRGVAHMIDFLFGEATSV